MPQQGVMFSCGQQAWQTREGGEGEGVGASEAPAFLLHPSNQTAAYSTHTHKHHTQAPGSCSVSCVIRCKTPLVCSCCVAMS